MRPLKRPPFLTRRVARMATVTVSADQAVQGHFPEVCAKTGRASNGWMTIKAKVGRFSLERLVIRVPWTEGQRLRGVAVDLDATKRWIILDGVHPDFVAAVLAEEDTTSRSDSR